MKPYHIEGMGVVGSTVAWTLHNIGVPFTWHDIEWEYNAWEASTSCIFPTGKAQDMLGYKGWTEWVDGLAPWELTAGAEQQPGLVEACDYWYCTKGAPHQSKVKPVSLVREGDTTLRLHGLPSMHLHTQKFVRATRRVFADQRISTKEGKAKHDGEPDRYIVAHGFNVRMKRVLWGWTAPVTLGIDDRLLAAGRYTRPCFYFRPNRYVLCYAFPIAGTSEWYAGSSLIHQETPKRLHILPKLARWQDDLHKYSGGMLQVQSIGEPVEGWRPSTGKVANEGTESLWVRDRRGRLLVQPMFHQGVRWMPNVQNALRALL